ncbi:MAG: hypothetical protein ACLS61_18550 [Ruminococcus sp.]
MVTATNAKYGISRVWKIFYEMDLREIFSLNEDDIVGSMITRVDIETYDTSGWMANLWSFRVLARIYSKYS